MDDAGLITSPNSLNLSHLSKRAVVSLSMIVVALISAFLAGSAVGFAVQGQVAKQHAKQLEQEIDKVEARVNILKGNIEMATFLNSISSLASHNMATTVILAHSVARMANYYATEQLQSRERRRSSSRRRSRRSRTTSEKTSPSRCTKMETKRTTDSSVQHRSLLLQTEQQWPGPNARK